MPEQLSVSPESMSMTINEILGNAEWELLPSAGFESRQKKFIGHRREDGAEAIVYQQRDPLTHQVTRNVVSMTGSDLLLEWKPTEQEFDHPARLERAGRISQVLQRIVEGIDYGEA